jgi:predicted metal-dependent hydrolase
MTDITVRAPAFEFPDDLDDVFPGDDLAAETYLVAFSLTMPSLEPYLIRSFRAALPDIERQPDAAAFVADVRAFIGQEAQHHRHHRRVNEIILDRLDAEVAAELRGIVDRLDAVYRRYTSTKSHRFNVAYAEGFEAMTCAMAMSMMERAASGRGSARFGAWQQLWAWHAAEEIEHRTVAFEFFERISGSYPVRVWASARTQLHYSWYLARLQSVLMAAHGRRRRWYVPTWLRQGWRRYVRTFSPRYHPAALDAPALAGVVLAMYQPAAG